MDAEDDPRRTIGLTGARFGGASRRKAKKRAAARAAGEPVTEVISAVAAEEPNVVPDAGFVVYGPALVGLSRARCYAVRESSPQPPSGHSAQPR